MTQHQTNPAATQIVSEESPRIYVACLAAYNNGILYGAWIDATQDPDAIMEEVQTMLKASPIAEEAEEWALHDYEGFQGIQLSEWEGFDQVYAIACFVEEHGELGADIYSYYDDLDEAGEALNDRYVGCYQSVADFAQELTDETTTIPKNLTYYIDYEQMGRDMEMSGDIFSIETSMDEVHIFWSR